MWVWVKRKYSGQWTARVKSFVNPAAVTQASSDHAWQCRSLPVPLLVVEVTPCLCRKLFGPTVNHDSTAVGQSLRPMHIHILLRQCGWASMTRGFRVRFSVDVLPWVHMGLLWTLQFLPTEHWNSTAIYIFCVWHKHTRCCHRTITWTDYCPSDVGASRPTLEQEKAVMRSLTQTESLPFEVQRVFSGGGATRFNI